MSGDRGGLRGHPAQFEPWISRLPGYCETCPEHERRSADWLLQGPDAARIAPVGRTTVRVCHPCLERFAPDIVELLKQGVPATWTEAMTAATPPDPHAGH